MDWTFDEGSKVVRVCVMGVSALVASFVRNVTALELIMQWGTSDSAVIRLELSSR